MQVPFQFVSELFAPCSAILTLSNCGCAGGFSRSSGSVYSLFIKYPTRTNSCCLQEHVSSTTVTPSASTTGIFSTSGGSAYNQCLHSVCVCLQQDTLSCIRLTVKAFDHSSLPKAWVEHSTRLSPERLDENSTQKKIGQYYLYCT